MKRALAALSLAAAACSATPDPDSTSAAVVVNTDGEAQRAQYDANIAFARSYRARCPQSGSGPRVLVTGFGRFASVRRNPTGMMVSTMVANAPYPESPEVPAGSVDPPGPQLSVGANEVILTGGKKATVCGMILPVYWDLAAYLIAQEIEAFRPDFVLMNGAEAKTTSWLGNDPVQPLVVELGSINLASFFSDSSGLLKAEGASAREGVPLLASEPRGDATGSLLSFAAVRKAALVALDKEKAEGGDKGPFGQVASGVKFQRFPRTDPTENAYICNNVTYVTNHLMAHPGKTIPLLQASHPAQGKPNDLPTVIRGDFTRVPRVFLHWPADLVHGYIAPGARVMQSVIEAQLEALEAGDAPILGRNDMAD